METLHEQFLTVGVLPEELALPKFSVVPERMVDAKGERIEYQDWINTYLSRLATYGALSEAAGVMTTLQEFGMAQAGANSANNLALLGGVIREVAGIEGGKGKLLQIVPVSVTSCGAKAIVDRYAKKTNGGRYYKRRT